MKKRMISLLLAAFLLLTGCGSIVEAGNYHTEKFDPPPIPKIPEFSADSLEPMNVSYKDSEKYKIAGTRAFYIPQDSNEDKGIDPDDILEFKVLDYTKDGNFIYAYKKNYRGSVNVRESAFGKEIGIKGEAKFREVVSNNKNVEKHVLVLMSYNPITKKYQVFGSIVENKDENVPLIASKIVGKENYFMFHKMTSYIYDSKGNNIFFHDYGSLISQEIGRIALAKTGKSNSHAFTVTKVTIDGAGYLYANVTIDLNVKKDEDETSRYDGLTDTNNDSSTEAPKSISAIITAFNIDIGGDNPSVKFISRLKNADEQERLYTSINGQVFNNKITAELTAKALSLETLKKTDGTKDEFEPFYAGNEDLTVELTGYTDGSELDLNFIDTERKEINHKINILNLVLNTKKIFEGRNDLTSFMQDGKDKQTEDNKIGHVGDSYRLYETFINNFGNEKGLIYKIYRGERTVAYAAAKKALALMGRGDGAIINAATTGKVDAPDRGNNKILYIPYIKPGDWDEENQVNENPLTAKDENGAPLTDDWYKQYGYPLPLLFGYQRGEGGQSKYSEIYIDKALNDNLTSYKDFEPRMEIEEKKELSRSYSYTDVLDQTKSGVIEEKITLPTAYRLVWPKDTYFYWISSRITTDFATSAGDFGAMYYGQEGDKSFIRFRYGQNQLLEDKEGKGRVVDAGILTRKDVANYPYLLTDKELYIYKDWNRYRVIDLREMIIRDGYSLLIRDKEDEKQLIAADTLNLISSDKIVYSGGRDGLTLYNLKQGINYSMAKGSFYRSFVDPNNNNQILAVGFLTDRFTYSQKDMVLSRYYIFDFGANENFNKNLINNELLAMRDLYLHYRYKTKKVGDNLVVDNDILPYEKKRLELARKLYSDNQAASWEALAHLLVGVGIGENESQVAYAKEQLKVIKDRENKKQEGMKEFFNLTTVESGRKLAEENSLTSGYFRNFSGRLDKVNSLGGIKTLLVELMLRDEIINSFSGHRKERLINLKKKSNEETNIAKDKIAGSIYYIEVLQEVALLQTRKRTENLPYLNLGEEDMENLEKKMLKILLSINPDAKPGENLTKEDLERAEGKSIIRQRKK